MTHASPPSHGTHSHATPAVGAPFSAAELAGLHAEDVSAARAIVALMMGIFSMGVLGYLIVCAWVA